MYRSDGAAVMHSRWHDWANNVLQPHLFSFLHFKQHTLCASLFLCSFYSCFPFHPHPTLSVIDEALPWCWANMWIHPVSNKPGCKFQVNLFIESCKLVFAEGTLLQTDHSCYRSLHLISKCKYLKTITFVNVPLV